MSQVIERLTDKAYINTAATLWSLEDELFG